MTPVTPAESLAALATHGRVAAPRAAPTGDHDAVLAGISSSYFRLRRGLAVITLAFPIVLWLGAGPGDLQGSLSAYYHFARVGIGGGSAFGAGTMRDVFVGVLWTIGSFLFFYRGYSRPENWMLNLAGAAAVAVSLSPMDWPTGSPLSLHGRIHAAAAVVFFLAIAYVCIVRSGDTLALLPEATRRRFARRYRILGTLMIAAPLTVVAIHLLAPQPSSPVVWAIEVAGTWTFAVFWLVKSREIALIESGP